jgi:short-subunit dehydrogenase
MTSSRSYWAGRKTLITGGSSGIGKQVAMDLLKLGAHVGIVADGADKLTQAVDELKRISPHVWSCLCDVAVLDDVSRMARAYCDRFDAPQVLINNAGYAVYESFERMPLEEIRRLFDVNLTGAALVTRAFLPAMKRAGSGDIVMVSSIAGRIPMTPCSVYSASKHGLVTLAELLEVEIARFNMRVQVVCPGRVETAFFSHESFQRRAHRPEAARTVPIETVSQAIVRAIEHNRFLTYVPRHYAALAWLSRVFPVLFRPVWRHLMTSRVDSIYDSVRGERPRDVS